MGDESVAAPAWDGGTNLATPRRTVVVWFIIGYVVLGIVMTPMTMWTAYKSMPGMPLWLLIGVVPGLAVNAMAAYSLYRLRSVALTFFAIAFVLAVAGGLMSMAYMPLPEPQAGFSRESWTTMHRAIQLFGMAFSVIIYSAMLFYLVRLRRRGGLR